MDTSNAITLTVKAAATPVPPTTIPQGECSIISKNTIAACWEGPPPAGGGTIQKAVQAWTSGVDVPGFKLFSGGGDADCWDTAVYAFDYSSGLWSRIKDRTTALGWNPPTDKARPAGDPLRFDRGYCEHGDGTPAAPHTYDLMEAVSDGFIYPLTRFAYPQDGSNWAHQFTLSSKQWSRVGAAASGHPGEALGMAAYDPVGGKLWLVPATPSGFWANKIEWLDPATGARGTKGLSTDYLICSGCARVWNNSLVWIAKDGLSVLDLAGSVIEKHAIGSYWDGAGFAFGGGYFWTLPSAASKTITCITPGTWEAVAITMGGVTPAGSANGIWKRLAWNDALGALTWYYQADGPVYAYRP